MTKPAWWQLELSARDNLMRKSAHKSPRRMRPPPAPLRCPACGREAWRPDGGELCVGCELRMRSAQR